jgi:uncharacterized protein
LILLDTSGLLAAFDESEPRHIAALAAIRSSRPPRLLSPFVLAEIDYMLTSHFGDRVEVAFLDDVARGAYALDPFSTDDLRAALQVLGKYADLHIGLADASIVVLAERHGCTDVLSLDERHFRTLRTSDGQRFRILPADAS